MTRTEISSLTAKQRKQLCASLGLSPLVGDRYLQIMLEEFWSEPERKYEHLSGYRWARHIPHTTQCPYQIKPKAA